MKDFISLDSSEIFEILRVNLMVQQSNRYSTLLSFYQKQVLSSIDVGPRGGSELIRPNRSLCIEPTSPQLKSEKRKPLLRFLLRGVGSVHRLAKPMVSQIIFAFH